jgi:hypothetical protein
MHGQFHPMDWSPKVLLKTMLDKLFEGPPTVDQYVRLFEKFILENGGRAQKNGVPLTYMEIMGLWNTFIAPSPINIGAPTLPAPLARGRGSPRKTCARTGTPTRPSHSAPSLSGGKFLKHSCSKKTQGGRSCGSEGHGFYTH